MPPPPQPKKIKRGAVVIEEDTYQAALEHIIRRDFFGSLTELEAQQEYLDALESRDVEWSKEAGRKLTQAMTPRPESRRKRNEQSITGRAGETPRTWVGATPMSEAGSEAPSIEEKKLDVDINMSLSAFMSKHVSEDSESYYALVDKQNAKRREQNAWLYNGNKLPSKHQLAVSAHERRLIEASKSPATAMELALKAPEDNRPAGPQHRPSAPRNSLMFPPDSVEDTHQTRAQAAEASSNVPPKVINYHNTHLPTPKLPSGITRPPSPTLSAIDAAIAGHPRTTESEAGYSGAETPRVAGYAFVDSEPTDAEKAAFEPDHEALWAALQKQAKKGPNPFKVSEATEREKLRNKLIEKMAASKRSVGVGRSGELAGEAVTGKTTTPKFLSALGGKTPRISGGSFTPAGQKLLGKIGTPLRKDNWFEANVAAVETGRTGLTGVTPKAKK